MQMGFLLPRELLFPFPCVARPPSAWAGIFNINAISHSRVFLACGSVERQQAQRCKLFLGKLARAISSPGEPKPLEVAGTAGAGAQHQCRGLCKVDVTLGPPVQFGNPLGCVGRFNNHG